MRSIKNAHTRTNQKALLIKLTIKLLLNLVQRLIIINYHLIGYRSRRRCDTQVVWFAVN